MKISEIMARLTSDDPQPGTVEYDLTHALTDDDMLYIMIEHQMYDELAMMTKILKRMDDRSLDSTIVKAEMVMVNGEHARNIDFVLNLPGRLAIPYHQLLMLRFHLRKSVTIPRLDSNMWTFLEDQRSIAQMSNEDHIVKMIDKSVRIGDKIAALIRSHPGAVIIDNDASIVPPSKLF
jgi:hypothetical protein